MDAIEEWLLYISQLSSEISTKLNVESTDEFMKSQRSWEDYYEKAAEFGFNLREQNSSTRTINIEIGQRLNLVKGRAGLLEGYLETLKK